MVKNIIVTNIKNIQMTLCSEKEKDDFTKIMTVLDPTKAAKTLFHGRISEVHIEYQEKSNDETDVKLINNDAFYYDDLENLINHMIKHQMEISHADIAKVLSQGRLVLPFSNIMFCEKNGIVQANLKVSHGVIEFTPMSEHCLNQVVSVKLCSMLEQKLHKCSVENGKIHITGTDIHVAILAVISVMILFNIINAEDRETANRQLLDLALKDLAKNEVDHIKKLAKYPADHPLSKYKNIALEAESIFDCLSSGAPLGLEYTTKLDNALNRQAEFSLAPQIIMRSFEKLKNNFHNEMHVLIQQKISE